MEGSHLDLVHQGGSTRIWMGSGALGDAASHVTPWLMGRRVFVVSSAPVRRLHRGALDELVSGAVEVVDLEVPDGEGCKTLSNAEGLLSEMLAAGGKRDSRVITLGGGTVGDLGGFAAGCFLRGIEYAQVPTTLLGQVDAAIGGKTGVNLPEAKNSVGLFHQPRWVISDPLFLSTLPAEEIRQALFEVVKAAILDDEFLFEMVEVSLVDLLAGAPQLLASAVYRAASVKVSIVENDEREGDRRRLLNLGHTLGHALETVAGHGRLRHGDAVGHGILFAARLAESRGLEQEDATRIGALLGRLDLPPLQGMNPVSVVEAIGRDKKARESGLAWVLPMAVGRAEIAKIPSATVEQELASFLTESVE